MSKCVSINNTYPKQLAKAVRFLDIGRNASDNNINAIVQKIRDEIKAGHFGEYDIPVNDGEVTVKCKIQPIDNAENGEYSIEFVSVTRNNSIDPSYKKSQDEDLAVFKGMQLFARKIGEEYKLEARFGEGQEELIIGGTNEKIPYTWQASALTEGLAKHLALVATATGSGKTIVKLMFALAAKLNGKKVISVNPRNDLVDQEYHDQKGVFHSKKNDINYDNSYVAEKEHNIVDLEVFFTNFNAIVGFNNLMNVLKENNAAKAKFEVDLEKGKIVIGRNIEIYNGYYTINGNKIEQDIFAKQDMLILLDELQDMVNKGESYDVMTRLLLLLGSWKKINLVITTATPPNWVKDFIERSGYIQNMSLQDKIRQGIGSEINIEVRRNTKNNIFITQYIRYHDRQVLERPESKQYYYNHKSDGSDANIKKGGDSNAHIEEKIRKYLIWNLQSARNRTTLACIDDNEAQKKLQDYLWGETTTLSKIAESLGELQSNTSNNSSDMVQDRLLKEFGESHKQSINKVLECFDYKSSFVDSGVFAVQHGIIDNVISCMLDIPLNTLSEQRFSDIESLQQKVREKITLYDDDDVVNTKINQYVSNSETGSSKHKNKVIDAMKVVWEVFKNSDSLRQNELLDNHNLSKEIHRMMPPILKCEVRDLLSIFEGEESTYLFNYLQENYAEDQQMRKSIMDIGKACDKCYQAYKQAKQEAEKCEEECEQATTNVRKANAYAAVNMFCGNSADLSEQNRIRETRDSKWDALTKKTEEVKKKKWQLVNEFKKISTEFTKNEKYPLHELRKICEELSIYQPSKDKSECDGDKLSRTGLVGYYFNNSRISGFNNTVLHNVVMRETREDNLDNKKQCVGRVGRKNSPIIASAYVDSSKVRDPQKIKDELINSGSLSAAKEIKVKGGVKGYTERIVKEINGIINKGTINNSEEGNQFFDEKGYNKLISDVFQRIGNLHSEIYNHSGYKSDETNKIFGKVLKSATSALKEQLNAKGIVTGDCKIELGIKILESRISKFSEELDIILPNQIKCIQGEKDQISSKLKIEANFLKVLIIKFCTLVLRLWHFRFILEKSDVEKVLNTDKITLKERVGLIREEKRIKNLESSLLKEQSKLHKEVANLEREKKKLQGQYDEICKHRYIGVYKVQDAIEPKEITKKDADVIGREQCKYIESELTEIQCRLHKLESDKDLDFFNKNTSTLSNLEHCMESLDTQLRKIALNYKESDSTIEYLENAATNPPIVIVEKLNTLHKLNLIDSGELNPDIISELDELRLQTETQHNEERTEYNTRVNAITITLKEKVKAIGNTRIDNVSVQRGDTKLESLYRTIKHQYDSLYNQHLFSDPWHHYNNRDIKKLSEGWFLQCINAFKKEKKRVEQIQKEQQECKAKESPLQDEIDMLNSNDVKTKEICRKLMVYKFVNRHYDIKQPIWMGLVFYEFVKKLTESQNSVNESIEKYIRSQVFLECFTNIVGPYIQNGVLEMAFEIYASSNGGTVERARNISTFYNNLLNKDFKNIESNFSEIVGDTMLLWLCTFTAKTVHHAHALHKDFDLIKSLTFGKCDLMEKISNIDSPIIGKLSQGLFSWNPFKEIRGNHFNTGSTLFSTMNLALTALHMMTDDIVDNSTIKNMFGSRRVREARAEVARLGEGVHKENAQKFIYEYLEMFRLRLNGCRDYTIPKQHDHDLPSTLSYFPTIHTLAGELDIASTEPFNSSLLTNPNVQALNPFQQVMASQSI